MAPGSPSSSKGKSPVAVADPSETGKQLSDSSRYRGIKAGKTMDTSRLPKFMAAPFECILKHGDIHSRFRCGFKGVRKETGRDFPELLKHLRDSHDFWCCTTCWQRFETLEEKQQHRQNEPYCPRICLNPDCQHWNEFSMLGQCECDCSGRYQEQYCKLYEVAFPGRGLPPEDQAKLIAERQYFREGAQSARELRLSRPKAAASFSGVAHSHGKQSIQQSIASLADDESVAAASHTQRQIIAEWLRVTAEENESIPGSGRSLQSATPQRSVHTTATTSPSSLQGVPLHTASEPLDELGQILERLEQRDRELRLKSQEREERDQRMEQRYAAMAKRIEELEAIVNLRRPLPPGLGGMDWQAGPDDQNNQGYVLGPS